MLAPPPPPPPEKGSPPLLDSPPLKPENDSPPPFSVFPKISSPPPNGLGGGVTLCQPFTNCTQYYHYNVISYTCQIWGLLGNPSLHKVERVKKASLQIITSADFNAHCDPIFLKLKILKLQHHITLLNILSSFNNFLITNNDFWQTRQEYKSKTILVSAPNYNSVKYGRKSITHTCLSTWNRFAVHIFPETNLANLPIPQLKNTHKKYFLNSYKCSEQLEDKNYDE